MCITEVSMSCTQRNGLASSSELKCMSLYFLIVKPSLTLPRARFRTACPFVAFLAASVAGDVFRVTTRKSSIGGDAGKLIQVDLLLAAPINGATCFRILRLLSGFSTSPELVASFSSRVRNQSCCSSGIVAVVFLKRFIIGGVGG